MDIQVYQIIHHLNTCLLSQTHTVSLSPGMCNYLITAQAAESDGGARTGWHAWSCVNSMHRGRREGTRTCCADESKNKKFSGLNSDFLHEMYNVWKIQTLKDKEGGKQRHAQAVHHDMNRM